MLVLLLDQTAVDRTLGRTPESKWRPISVSLGGGPTIGRSTFATVISGTPRSGPQSFRVEGDLFAANREALIELASELARA